MKKLFFLAVIACSMMFVGCDSGTGNANNNNNNNTAAPADTTTHAH
jgi:hypothetical protein